MIPVRSVKRRSCVFVYMGGCSLTRIYRDVQSVIASSAIVVPIVGNISPKRGVHHLINGKAIISSLVCAITFTGRSFSVSRRSAFA